MSSIAAELRVTLTHVSEVVAGRRRSARVEQAVARRIGKPIGLVFPSRESAPPESEAVDVTVPGE